MANPLRLPRLVPAALTVLMTILWPTCFAARCGAAPRAADGAAGVAGGDEKPAKEAKPAVVGTLSVRSLDALKKLADEMHVDLPPFLTPAGIENVFPFIGPGGMASDRPIGFVFFGSPTATAQTACAFVLPVNPNAAELGPLQDKGAQPLAGHPDTVVLNNIALRRTHDNLIFGPMTDAVADVREAVVADAVAAPGSLAHVVVDVKAMREVMPEQFKAWLKEQEEKENEKNAAAGGAGRADEKAREAGRKLGEQWVEDWMATGLDRMDLSVDRAADGLRLSTGVRPVAVPTAGNFDRPALPAGCLFRVDLAFNAGQFYADASRSFLKKVMEIDEQTPADQKQQVWALGGDLVELWVSGDATTMAVAEADGNLVYYQVSQYNHEVDAIGRLKRLVGKVNAINEKNQKAANVKSRAAVTLESYAAADGSTVTRFKPSEEGNVKGFLDAVQKGRRLYVVAGESPAKAGAHHIDALLSAKADPARAGAAAKMKGFASGTIDLAKVVRFGFEHPNNDVQLPEEQRKQIEKIVEGQSLDWTARGDGRVLWIDMTLPKGLLENLSKLAKEEAEK